MRFQMYLRDGANRTSQWSRNRGDVGGHKEISSCWVAPLLGQGEMQEEQFWAHRWAAGYQRLELRGEAESACQTHI